MIIKFKNIDTVIVCIPESVCWEIRVNLFDEESYDDGGIYLNVQNKQYQIRNVDMWCMGRTKLPFQAVVDLYEEMVNVITKKFTDNQKMIDIDVIEAELIDIKYKNLWNERGYIQIDINGFW